MFQKLRKVLRKLEEDELIVLVGLLIVVMGTWGFIALADEVSEGDTQHFDERLIRALRTANDPAVPIGPVWVQEVGRDLTALGGYAVLVTLVLIVSGYLFLAGKKGAMCFLLAAVVGGYFLERALKASFSRPRPDVVPHLSQVYNTSFPSGHTMMSAIVYLTIGALLSRFATNERRLKLYFISIALLLTSLVGLSRIYLGVHYPTDVLAGWTAGLVWAALCSLIAQQLQNRGMIETGR